MKQFCSLLLYASSPKGISLYHMDTSQYTDLLEVERSCSVKLSILQLTSIYFKTSQNDVFQKFSVGDMSEKSCNFKSEFVPENLSKIYIYRKEISV